MDIVAAWPDSIGSAGIPSDNRWTEFNMLFGTSMARPHVSLRLYRIAESGTPKSEPSSNLLCSTFLHLIPEATDNSSYSSPEVFRISCGGLTTDLTDRSGLKWTSDHRPKFLLSSSNTNIDSINTPSSHTCSFLVSAGRKFIRLHFYPANCSGLDAADALFNITSGRYTLLHDFSSYNTTKAMNFDYLVREFSVCVDDDGFLDITFTPSREIPDFLEVQFNKKPHTKRDPFYVTRYA
ncbi:hypothetical protein ACLOJK_038151 [Asimina triloba]